MLTCNSIESTFDRVAILIGSQRESFAAVAHCPVESFSRGATVKEIPQIVPDENWRRVVDWEELYEVSSLGRVRRIKEGMSTHPGRLLKLTPDKWDGYVHIGLSRKGKTTSRKVHVLVAAAFLGPRPLGYEINHKDGVKTNNSALNLEYVTPQENKDHAVRMGLVAKGMRNGAYTCPESRHGKPGISNPAAKLTPELVAQIKELRAAGHSQRQVARMFVVSQRTIYNIDHDLIWQEKVA